MVVQVLGVEALVLVVVLVVLLRNRGPVLFREGGGERGRGREFSLQGKMR